KSPIAEKVAMSGDHFAAVPMESDRPLAPLHRGETGRKELEERDRFPIGIALVAATVTVKNLRVVDLFAFKNEFAAEPVQPPPNRARDLNRGGVTVELRRCDLPAVRCPLPVQPPIDIGVERLHVCIASALLHGKWPLEAHHVVNELGNRGISQCMEL